MEADTLVYTYRKHEDRAISPSNVVELRIADTERSDHAAMDRGIPCGLDTELYIRCIKDRRTNEFVDSPEVNHAGSLISNRIV